MGNYATQAELQQDAATWIWNQIADGAISVSQVLNTPEWSEFDVTTPDGTRAVVRVEVKA